jgi:hypothetical protein
MGRPYKTYVRAFYVKENPSSRGFLFSQEIFHEQPQSSLHAVSSLAIQCNNRFNRLCLLGFSPPAQSHASLKAHNCSSKHSAAIEVIRMRKYADAPSAHPVFKPVHSLGMQMRDDINSLQFEISKLLDQRAKASPFHGEMHSVGGSGTPSGIFEKFLHQRQWWEVGCPLTLLSERL